MPRFRITVTDTMVVPRIGYVLVDAADAASATQAVAAMDQLDLEDKVQDVEELRSEAVTFTDWRPATADDRELIGKPLAERVADPVAANTGLNLTSMIRAALFASGGGHSQDRSGA